MFTLAGLSVGGHHADHTAACVQPKALIKTQYISI